MAKIKDEQLQKINEFKQRYNEIVFLLGDVEIRKKELEFEHNSLLNDFGKIREEEQKLLEEIQKEYGDGNLDVNTGEFTPKSSQ